MGLLPVVAVAAVVSLGTGCTRPGDGVLSGKPELAVSGTYDQAKHRADGTADVAIAWTPEAGQHYVLELDQRDADAELAIVGADGRDLVRVAGPAKDLGREYLYFEARASTPLSVRVHARGRPPRDAGYALQVHRLPPDSAASVRDAFQRMTRAASTTLAADASRAEAMLEDYRAAERTWRGRDARLAADAALQSAAVEYWLRDHWQDAIDAAERAAATGRDANAPELVADADVLAGLARLELARERRGADADGGRRLLAEAEAGFQRARSTYAAAQRPVAAAATRVYAGTARYYAYDLAGAVREYATAEADFERLGADDARALVLTNLAVTSADRGDYATAAREYERLIAATTEHDDELRATMLVNSAGVLLYVGETSRALERYVDALRLSRRIGSERTEVQALFGLGICHLYLGQPDVAVTHLQATIDRLGTGDRHTRVLALLRLGDARRALRDLPRAATAHAEAAKLAATLGAPALQARVAVARGDDQVAAGRLAAAVRAYSDALALQLPEPHAVVARALVGRGRAQRLAGDFAAAREDLERAAALATASGNREERIAATYERAELAAQTGARDEALALATQAADDIRELTGAVTNPDSRVTLAVRLRAAQELRVALLADASLQRRAARDRKGADERAFEALLAADDAQPDTGTGRERSGIGPRADDGRRLMDELAARRLRLETLSERNAKPTPTMLAIEREIAELRSQVTRAGEARTAAPTRGARLDLAALRERIPAGSVLVAYSLGAERSWRWTLARDRFDLDALPPAREIDRGVEQLLDAVRALQAPERANAAARGLAARVLPANLPVGTRRLVVPDGSLGAVPWALLGDDAAAPTLQLASLRTIVDDARDRRPWTVPTRLVLFGDPVFGSGDPRIAADSPSLDRPLPRLPGTAREVAAIAALAPAGEARVVTGADATRAAVLALPRDGVDVLHLATHATLDAEVPALASLVMSRRDASGRTLAAELRPDEIARLPAAAPLVVLSACDAAAEPSRAAAGLMNLTRAFLAGGSRYVVASRWAVGDASAVALMTEFYRGLLVERLPPDAALARAQRTLAATPTWRAPFHWAGFVVTGVAP
jgi:tetratricopeptide (TPR) repeat protein